MTSGTPLNLKLERARPSGAPNFAIPNPLDTASAMRDLRLPPQPNHRCLRPQPSRAPVAARSSQCWDWAAVSRGPLRPFLPILPRLLHTGNLVSNQVKQTTVAPWSFRAWLESKERRTGTRALRFVALVCIPVDSPTEAQTHFSEEILQALHRIVTTAAQPDTTGRASRTRGTL